VNDRPELLGDARFVYASWHEYLFVPTYLYARPDTTGLGGQHRDAEILSQISERFGYKVVRGSSTRGGIAAVLRILRDPNSTRHIGLTPDGPKGPRRKCQVGAVYLASRIGLPLVPCGFGYSRCWRAKSWDRLAVPLPFSRIRCVTAHAIYVPPGLGTAELAPYQTEVEEVMNHATAVAEQWAKTGEFDPLGYKPPPHADIRPEQQKAWPSARLVCRGGRSGP
jgi:lysophospholipid acyltransferase (LPLAT)-like uncharacterized protein